MKVKHTGIDNQRANIAKQLAGLSVLLRMMPSHETITVHAPLIDEIMVLSDWFSAIRNSFLKLSILISKELYIQLQ